MRAWWKRSGSGDDEASTVRAILLEPFGLASPFTTAPAVDWSAVVAAGSEHRVLGALQRGTALAFAPTNVQDDVRVEYFTGLTRHLKYVDLLRRLAMEFDARHIRWVVVKGPVLSELMYPSVDLRAYTDLDLLVHPHDFATVIDLLEAAGGEVVERNWTLMTRQGRGELAVRMPDGTFVDVHWHLLIDPDLRRQISLPTAVLLERSHRALVAGIELPMLDPLDALVHLVVHAALAGGHRWRWSLDILFAARRISGPGDALPSVSERIGSARAEPFAAVMQERARRVLGVGEELTVSQRRNLWSALVRTYDTIHRPERWFGQIGSGRQIVAATRPTSASSVAAIGTSIAGTVRSIAMNPGHRWRPARFRREVPLPKPILDDDPSPTGRSTYFTMVQSQTWA